MEQTERTEQTGRTERNSGIDLFRALASLMVVAIHVGGFCFDLSAFDWKNAGAENLAGGGYCT